MAIKKKKKKLQSHNVVVADSLVENEQLNFLTETGHTVAHRK